MGKVKLGKYQNRKDNNVYPVYKTFNKITKNNLNKYIVKKYLEDK